MRVTMSGMSATRPMALSTVCSQALGYLDPLTGWDEVARAYLAQRGIWRPTSTWGGTGNAFPHTELVRVRPR